MGALSPIDFACAFIPLTNRVTFPPSCSARATAASFAEIMISACSSASSGTFLPRGSSPVADPGVCAAFRLTRTRSPGRFVFATISAVIILVRLAIGCSSRGLRCQSTAPIFTSKRIPAAGGCLNR